MIRGGHLFALFAAVLGIAMLPSPARATTINTYAFSQGAWQDAKTGDTDGIGLVTGTFTGVVGPGGAIGLSDLTAFSMEGRFFYGSFLEFTTPFLLSDLQFFSFNADAPPMIRAAEDHRWP